MPRTKLDRLQQSSEKRLIDANALIEEAYAEGAYGYVDAKQIADAPTIDAVEVVRCRECKHFKIGEDNVYYCRRDKLGRGIFMRKSDFCSYGERKDGDGNG